MLPRCDPRALTPPLTPHTPPPLTAAPYTSVVDCVRATLRISGARGPFQGLSATLLRNAPANAVYLGSFEVLKNRAARYYGCEVRELPAPVVMAAGGTGGILYWLAIFPGAPQWGGAAVHGGAWGCKLCGRLCGA